MKPRERSDYPQCLEILLSAIYHRSVKPGDTVIDGGANAGLHTIPMANLVYPDGKVYAYEPQEQTAAALQRWIDWADRANVCVVREVAIGAYSGNLQFFCNAKSTAHSSARRMDSNDADWIEVQVPVVRIDDENIEGRCSFIKLDLEGGERDALIGASEIINRDKPVVAFENALEWAAHKFNYGRFEILDFFANSDYEVYDFSGTKACAANLAELVCEFIAFHKSDPRRFVIMDTISEFNSRFSKVKPPQDWNEVVALVHQPFSSGFWGEQIRSEGMSHEMLLQLKSQIDAGAHEYVIDTAIREYLLAVVNSAHNTDVFLVQVGADDGKMNDPVSALVRSQGWRALLIEPVPEFFAALQETYSSVAGIEFVNAACASSAALLPFWQVRNLNEMPHAWMRGLSTCKREVIRKHFSSESEFEKFVIQVEVNVSKLDDILAARGIEKVDVLVVDTEGYDLEVLKGFDAASYRPELIIAEHHHLSPDERLEMRARLHDAGYLRVVGYFDTYFYRPAAFPSDAVEFLLGMQEGIVAKQAIVGSGVKSGMDIITVAYGIELPMLKLQARSIRLFFAPEAIGVIFVINNDQDQAKFRQDFMDQVLPEYGHLSPLVRLIDRGEIMPGFGSCHGWNTQQVLKLIAASQSERDYCLILDAKNHFVRPVTDRSYQTDDGRLVSYLVSQRGHLQHLFANSFAYFGVDPEQFKDRSLPNVTPFPVRTATVRDMLKTIEAKENRSFAEFFLNGGKRFAEFYLLAAYIVARDNSFDKEYVIAAANVVTVFPDKANVGAFYSIMYQLASQNTLAFGVHWAASPLLDEELRNSVARVWIERGLVQNRDSVEKFFSELNAKISAASAESPGVTGQVALPDR